MTTNGTGDGGLDGADELFRELVREHTQKGAAVRLGVSHNTVRRSLKAGRLSHLLRGKLEAHLLRHARGEKILAVAGDADQREAEKGVAVVGRPKDPRDGNGIAALSEMNLPDLNNGQLESGHSEVPLRKLVAVLALKVERLERNRTSAQSAGTGQDPAALGAREPGSDGGATAEGSAADETDAEDDEPATPGDTSGGGPGAARLSDAGAWEAMRAIAAREDVLLRRWWDARILESAARTQLERVIARQRTLQAEMAIAWERDKATRLGEAWYATSKEREWEWRWRALREVSGERRRLIRRRRLRRLLSLGLWRS